MSDPNDAQEVFHVSEDSSSWVDTLHENDASLVSLEHRRALYEAARKATAGPWCLWDDGDVGTAYPVEVSSRPYVNRHSGANVPANTKTLESKWIANSSFENGEYLALVDPQTIIALLRRLTELEEQLSHRES